MTTEEHVANGPHETGIATEKLQLLLGNFDLEYL